MTGKAIIPSDLQNYYDDWHMSPGLVCNGFVFMTGFTGVGPDGVTPSDAEAQIRQCFSKMASVLEAGGMRLDDVVEMTSFHVGLQDHLALFRSIRDEYVREPYPAWTAIEVSGFVSKGAIVEIRVIAKAAA